MSAQKKSAGGGDDERKLAVVAAIIQKLEQNGRCTPRRVLAAARSPDSPLHPYFEWDDTVAAEAHRIEQARALIRRIKIEIEYREEVRIAPKYLHDAAVDAGDQGYVSMTKLRREPANKRAVIQMEIDRILGLLNRLRDIAMGLGNDAIVSACNRCESTLNREFE